VTISNVPGSEPEVIFPSSRPYAPIPADGLAQWRWAIQKLPKGSSSRAYRIKRVSGKVIRARFKLPNFPTIDLEMHSDQILTTNHILHKVDISLTRDVEVEVLNALFSEFSGFPLKIAVHTAKFSNFSELVYENKIDACQWDVYVIRGNNYFTRGDFKVVQDRFQRIYVHNLLGEFQANSRIQALPLGLNPNLVTSAQYISQFRMEVPSLGDLANRSQGILMNFDCSTNAEQRIELHKMLSGHPEVKKIPKIQASELRKFYSQFLFNLSPPGAGPDCYRTWESMLLGVIPIVLDSETPSFKEEFPLWRINEWQDLMEFSIEDLRTKAQEIWSQFQDFPLSAKYGV